MSTDISLQTTTYQVGNRQWLLSEPDVKLNVTLDISKFATAVSEVQTVTVDATGGTFTLTYSGQTTTAIAEAAAASAVQSALEALSNIAVGDVTVTGSAGGPFTVTFAGALAGQNVAALTANAASLTGGAGTVVIATPTGGVLAHFPNGFIPSGTVIGKVTATDLAGPYDDTANDGRQVAYGITYGDVRALRPDGTTAVKVGTSAVVNDAIVSAGKLPFQTGAGSIDANGKVDLAQIRWEA